MLPPAVPGTVRPVSRRKGYLASSGSTADMAETAGPARDSVPSRPPFMSVARRATFWGFAGLVVLAVAFYVWWGVSFGVWLDNGVYAVVITLLLFGLAGKWLVQPNPPAPSPPPAS